MTNADVTILAQPGVEARNASSYVEWPAIIAGAVVAAAISTIMTAFGAALGLTGVSFTSGSSLSGWQWGLVTGLWVLWIAVSSFVSGGYLAGRLRRRLYDASEHESDVRDGAHGLIVWAIGALLIGWLAASSAIGVSKSAASLVGGVATLGAQGAQGALQGVAQPLVGRMFRSADANANIPDREIADATSILTSAVASGSLNDEDKAYLAAQVAARTGVSPADAAKRVDDAQAQLQAAADKAKQAAETARKTGILIAFLTAASFAISAAAAWWAAVVGGKHRDEGVDLSRYTAWR